MKDSGAMAASGGTWKTAEGHVKIYFGVSKEATETGIWKVWRGERAGRRNRTLEVTGEGEAGEGFWFAGTNTATGPGRGYLGAFFVSVDWRVRVFWSSGLKYRPSDHLYIHNIPLSGCIDRRYHYIPFSYQE